nr:hypothetical protein CFP56_51235 [Quercus suber]
MDQLLKSRSKSGDSMAANLGEEEQTQKGKEVGDQQKEQEAEAKAIEEDDHEEEEEEEEEDDDDDHHEEDDNGDETDTERLKSVPKEMKQLQHFSHPKHPLIFLNPKTIQEVYHRYLF